MNQTEENIVSLLELSSRVRSNGREEGREGRREGGRRRGGGRGAADRQCVGTFPVFVCVFRT